MARSTFKVLFYVNGSKEKDGIVPIMGRVTINGTVAQFSCKQTIPKTLWDAKGNRGEQGEGEEKREEFFHSMEFYRVMLNETPKVRGRPRCRNELPIDMK